MLAVALLLGAANVHAAGAPGAKAAELLSLCATCHGIDGISSVDLQPNLAGQKKAYLAKQLQDFRRKERVNEVMTPMAEPLDDAEIEQLAEYFSSRPGAE